MWSFQKLIKLKGIKKNKKYKNFINILLYLILFSLYIQFCFSKDINNKRKLEYENEITIKIFGSGENFVVYQWETITPDEVYVDGELKGTSTKKVDLGEEEKEYTVTLKWNTPQKNFYRLFFYLNILEVDISKLDTSQIENMSSMFKGCSQLTSLNFGNINTATLTSMAEMFYGCSKLTSLDLNAFDTSNVNDMMNMFYQCKKLEELHIESFDTSNVVDMTSMFYECISLTTLDLSNFRTSSVTTMSNMFQDCQSLISLNVESFDTSNVVAMNRIFYHCYSLISLNINSFDTSKVDTPQFCFEGIGDELIFCADPSKSATISNLITSYNNNCEDPCFSGDNVKLIKDNKECTNDSCENIGTYQYEYKNICYESCPGRTHPTIDNIYLCQEKPDYYYLDTNDNIFKPCYEGCNSCNGEGNNENHNCIDCKSNYKILTEINKPNNCYIECPFFYYFDSGVYKCTDENSCPSNYNKLISEMNKCIDSCESDDTYQYEYENKCYISCPGTSHYLSDNMFLCQDNPEGYYLDIDNIFKPCHEGCKSCSGEGNDDNHDCIDCKSNYLKLNEIDKPNNCYEECPFLYYFESGDYRCTEGNSCPSSYNKVISDKHKCIDNCQNDDTYHYEYENQCYISCPGTTHYSSDNMFLCQDNPEGYYLDIDNIYKPCYLTCQSCSREGDVNNHNCDICKEEFHFVDDPGYENNCYPICDNYYFDSEGEYHCISIVSCTSERPKYIKLKNTCIDECKNDELYQLEYNNECYITCPNDTHVSSDNPFLCQDNLEGYYLDIDNIFKPCHEGCKSCSGEGNDDNHDCIDCKSNYLKLNEIDKPNNCYEECPYLYYFESGIYKCTEGNSCRSNYNKLINEKNKCIDNCENDDTYSFEYNNRCILDCQTGTHLKNDNSKICYKDPEGYYLDTDNYYKPCFSLCKACNGQGDENNNNCKECLSNYILILNPQNYNNCYEKCEFFYYFNSSGSYHCTENNKCPEEQSKLVKSKSKCIDDCSKDEIYKYEENNICVKFSDNGKILICPINLPFEKQKECVETCTSEEFLYKECTLNNKDNITAQNNIIQSIKTDLTQGRLNSILSNVIKGNKTDFILEDANTTYQITSSDNQNNNEYENISSILLGDCEDKLRQTYHIPKSESLIIYKIDIKEEGLKIPIIEYEIYNPINLEKLELDCCKDIKIGISIPVTIDEDSLFKYNSSNEYYNDMCYSYTTKNGTDIVIKDRQNEFKDNNMSLCETDCEYTNYNSTTKKAFCECNAKNSIDSIFDIKNNKDKLMYTFKDLKNAINLEIMKCYKKMLNKDELVKNVGSYIILVILFIYIISLFAFLSKGYSLIYQTIHNLVVKINNENINNNKIKYKNNKINKSTIQNKGHGSHKIHKNKNNFNSSISINSSKNIYNVELRKKTKKRNTQKSGVSISHRSSSKKIKSNPTNKRRKNKNSTKMLNDDLSSIGHIHTKLDNKYSYKNKPSSKNKLKVSFLNEKNYDNRISIHQTKLKLQIFNYNDYEINNLFYTEAIGIDNRTYMQYYWSLIKQKHLVIFAFYTSNDYNSRIIKICLFFFNFGLYITVSALFFNYNTMHKIYEDSGSFNIIYQIPQIIYSTIISSLINILVKTLALTQKNILELKINKENIISKENSLMGCLKIKFVLFFLLSFIFLFFFWFYLACFCCIYPNTQSHLINDSSISFALSLIYPFFMNLFPGFFRIRSLKAGQKDKECLYKFSQIIQVI